MSEKTNNNETPVVAVVTEIPAKKKFNFDRVKLAKVAAISTAVVAAAAVIYTKVKKNAYEEGFEDAGDAEVFVLLETPAEDVTAS